MTLPRPGLHVARLGRLLLSATVVSIISLGSIVAGFWAFKTVNATNQIAVQVPVALLAGIAGLVGWFRLATRAHLLVSGADHVLTFAATIPTSAVLLALVHYLVTGYLTSFGNIVAAWPLLLCQYMIAALIAATVAPRQARQGDRVQGTF